MPTQKKKEPLKNLAVYQLPPNRAWHELHESRVEQGNKALFIHKGTHWVTFRTTTHLVFWPLHNSPFIEFNDLTAGVPGVVMMPLDELEG